jgi:hypothetical protein
MKLLCFLPPLSGFSQNLNDTPNVLFSPLVLQNPAVSRYILPSRMFCLVSLLSKIATVLAYSRAVSASFFLALSDNQIWPAWSSFLSLFNSDSSNISERHRSGAMFCVLFVQSKNIFVVGHGCAISVSSLWAYQKSGKHESCSLPFSLSDSDTFKIRPESLLPRFTFPFTSSFTPSFKRTLHLAVP